MTSGDRACHYRLFELGVSACSEIPDVAAAIEARLRFFRAGSLPRPDIRVSIRRVGSHAEGIARPDGASRPVYDAPSGEIVYFDESDLLYLDDGHAVRALSDCRHGTISMTAALDDTAVSWVASHPLLTIPLIDSLKRHGRYSLHAACLSLDDRGLLIAGASGSGKSTLTLALLRAGFDFLGDDLVFLTNENDSVVARAFPDEIDVTLDTIQFFPELSRLTTIRRRQGWPKHQVRPEEVYGITPTTRCVPRALVFPRVSGAERSLISPMDAHAALLELAPNILLTEPASSQKHFDVLAALVTQCRCYRLDTGTDLRSTTETLRDLLARQGS